MKLVTRILLAGAVGGLGVCGAGEPTRAHAQENDTVLQAAKAEFEEGQIEFIKEKFEVAAAKFLSAYDKKPFTSFLFNAAVSLEKASKFDRAVQYFQQYMDKDPEAKDAKSVRERIEHLKAMLEKPNAQPQKPTFQTKGLVIIDSKPKGASIYLDDKAAGPLAQTPWQGSLEPRSVKLIVEAKGFKPEERIINPRTDKVYEVYVALSEEHFLGWVEIASTVAGADVFMDDMQKGAIGKTPYSGHAKPGKHTVWIQRPGYQVATKEIEVQPGTAVTHSIPLERVDSGWITVVGRQSKGGQLTVDGVPTCNTPCQTMASAGKHKVVIAKPEMEPYRSELIVEKSTEHTINVAFNPNPPKTGAWTKAAFSAAFVAGGIYCGLQSKKLENGIRADIDKDLQVDTNDPRVGRGKLWAYGADGAFAVGTIIGLFSLYDFLSSGPPSPGEVDARVIGLVPIQGGASLFAQGRF